MANAIMNLADPELEMIDPTPNVHMLFVHFDKIFFWTKLVSRTVVRWSKRMYSCAGICSYHGRGSLCEIALSEPLLKLRPRKDLVETLLHEMIHAFLFITNRDQDRDGHGPNFKAHMHRINNAAGLNISIYHDFHDEVRLYQTHWWRCNGVCQTMRPHFGTVRRINNRAPGPSDNWWNDHKRKCGGTFIKIKEPEQVAKKKTNENKTNKNVTAKGNGDITKYINNGNIRTINNVPGKNMVKPVLKDSNVNILLSKTKTKPNNQSSFIVGKKGVVFNPSGAPKPVPQTKSAIQGSGNILKSNKHLVDTSNVREHVRNIWANKQIQQSLVTKVPANKLETSNFLVKERGKNTNPSSKHKADSNSLQSPPAKIKKIDDYFKANATSVLKGLYGDDIKLKQKDNNTKLVAVSSNALVDCPICSAKINSNEINKHLDECLNKDIIEKLSQDIQIEVNSSQSNINKNEPENEPSLNVKSENVNNNVVDLTNLNICNDNSVYENKGKQNTDSKSTSQFAATVTALVKHIQNNKDETNQKNPNNFRKTVDDILNTIETMKGAVSPNSVSSQYDGNEPQKQICPCCGTQIDGLVEQHLDECLTFFNSDTTIPDEGASTSFSDNTTIVIDDEEDIFDETQVFNATGTKSPCPCCMKMVEQDSMNEHLDICLGLV